MPCIVLIGDSHIHAVANARAAVADDQSPAYDIHEFGGTGADHNYHPMVVITDGQYVFNAAFVDDVIDCVARHDPFFIAAAWGGNQHYVHGVINHPRPYDFVLPSAPNLALVPGAELIPYDLLRSRFKNDAAHLVGLWNQLQARCRVPIYHLAAPPPVRRNMTIANCLPQDWRPQAEQLGVTAPSFRYKLWRLLMEMMQEASETVGVRFLWPPPEAIDTSGLLLSEYAGDGIHGNTEYGGLVVRQLDKLVETGIT